jgi:hypothetical protein
MIIYKYPLPSNRSRYLQSRNSILNQILKVRLVPLPRLGRRRERIRHATERIVPGGTRVAGAITLATRLDPHKRIHKRVACGACGTHAEPGTLDVAPVAPLLAQAGDAVAARVDDGLGGHACGFELRGEEGDVFLLVLGLVPLCIGGF